MTIFILFEKKSQYFFVSRRSIIIFTILWQCYRFKQIFGLHGLFLNTVIGYVNYYLIISHRYILHLYSEDNIRNPYENWNPIKASNQPLTGQLEFTMYLITISILYFITILHV